MDEYKDINWSVDFEITVNGKTAKFEDLSDDVKQMILKCIEGDFYSGNIIFGDET